MGGVPRYLLKGIMVWGRCDSPDLLHPHLAHHPTMSVHFSSAYGTVLEDAAPLKKAAGNRRTLSFFSFVIEIKHRGTLQKTPHSTKLIKANPPMSLEKCSPKCLKKAGQVAMMRTTKQSNTPKRRVTGCCFMFLSLPIHALSINKTSPPR